MNYPTLDEEIQICFVFLNIPCLTKVAQQFVADGTFNLDFYSKQAQLTVGYLSWVSLIFLSFECGGSPKYRSLFHRSEYRSP